MSVQRLFIPHCFVCGCEFTPKALNARYCSDPCREIAHRAHRNLWAARSRSQPERQCEASTCTTIFKPVRLGQLYCSRDCQPSQQYQTDPRRLKPGFCQRCEATFQHNARGSLKKHCSKRCKDAAGRARRRGSSEQVCGIPGCRRLATRGKGRCRKHVAEFAAKAAAEQARPIMLSEHKAAAANEARQLAVRERQCGNCTHWAGGSKGCVLEKFRDCQPGVVSKHWAEKPKASS